MAREVRALLVPKPIVRLGDVRAWVMVRDATNPYAVPFVISRKQWDGLEVVTL